MKVAFILPRYHPNFKGLVNGLIDLGHSLKMCVAYESLNEDHAGVSLMNFGTKYRFRGIPFLRVFSLRSYLKNGNFDLLIIRSERNIFTIQCFLASVFLNNKIVLYDQYDVEIRNLWLRLFVKMRDYLFRPLLCITPTFDKDSNTSLLPQRNQESLNEFESRLHYQFEYKSSNRYWLPFGINYLPRNVTKFEDRPIDFLISAKHERRKNVLEVLETLNNLADFSNKKLNIVYACISKLDKESLGYRNEIELFINQMNPRASVTILTDVDNSEMNLLYAKTKYFLLVSANEPAAFSNVEAIFNGCYCILSIDNGSISQHIRNLDYTLFVNPSFFYDTIVNYFSSKPPLPDTKDLSNLVARFYSSEYIARSLLTHLRFIDTIRE